MRGPAKEQRQNADDFMFAWRRGDLWMIKTFYLLRRLQLHGETGLDYILAEKDKDKLYRMLDDVQEELEFSKKKQDDDFIAQDSTRIESEMIAAFTESGVSTLQASGVMDRLKSPETRRQALIDLAEWIKETCLLFGAGPETAYQVAATLVGGLENERIESWRDEIRSKS